LLERKDRVNELGRLVSELPLANYTLLRLLTSHLIRVVKHSDINLMTVRNIAIVFSPTLGIPATIFNLFLSEFDYIFWTTKDGDAAPRRFEEEDDDEDDDEDDEDVSKGRSTAPDLNDDNEDSGVSTDEPAQMDIYHHAPHYQASDELLTPISSVVVPRRDNKKHLTIRETHGRNNRNSILYIDAAPNAIVDLEKQTSGNEKSPTKRG
jgi:RalA-binding protein 1